MNCLRKNYFICITIASTITALFVLALFVAASTEVQAGFPGREARDQLIFPTPTPAEKPIYQGYKGITVGMATDAARAALGKPTDQSDTQDMYVFSDRESAQIYYDASRIVTAISITYSGNLTGAPTPKGVFGEDSPPKPDGSIFKMMRYPKAGFWISYNKTAGDDSIIIIAIQKI